MGVGTMVFLGCPFRMLQRIGGGDLNAVVGLGGFLAGVGAGRWCESRGYSAGKTAVDACLWLLDNGGSPAGHGGKASIRVGNSVGGGEVGGVADGSPACSIM